MWIDKTIIKKGSKERNLYLIKSADYSEHKV